MGEGLKRAAAAAKRTQAAKKPHPATLAKIEREIEVMKSSTFLPDEYRRLRLVGVHPRDISYDMCHAWR